MSPDLNQIYTGDCYQVMRSWPDKCIDLVVTDPPYGLDIASTGEVGVPVLAPLKQYGASDWDRQRPAPEVFKEIQRVSKDQIIFGGNYFADLLPPSKCWLVWDKIIPKGFGKAQVELAWTSLSTYSRVYDVLWNGMIRTRQEYDEDRYHPTQKPVTLMRQIINDHADPGFTICDPFCGSGSILVAAQNLGFEWVGCEINPEYVQISQDRINREMSQLKLPLEVVA